MDPQQLREAFPWNEASRYLVRDRDAAFHAWATTARAMDIREVLTRPSGAMRRQEAGEVSARVWGRAVRHNSGRPVVLQCESVATEEF
jgi:hypothetical protein